VPLPPPGTEAPKPKNDVPKYTSMLDDPQFKDMFKVAETRAALQLGFTYLEDISKEITDFLRTVRENDLVLLSESDISPVRMLFAFNLLKHRLLNGQQLEETTLEPHCILILTESIELAPTQLSKIVDFVMKGGQILSFNSATTILEQAFPGYIRSKHGFTTVNKPVEIEVTGKADKELFSQYLPPHNKVTRMEGIRRFEIVDAPISLDLLLVKEVKPTQIPLAVHWTQGQGQVYHLLLSHVVDRQFFDVVPTRDSIQKIFKKHIEDRQDLRGSTKLAFRTAMNCGFHNSVNLALAYQPFLQFIFTLIAKLYHTHS